MRNCGRICSGGARFGRRIASSGLRHRHCPAWDPNAKAVRVPLYRLPRRPYRIRPIYGSVAGPLYEAGS